MLHMLLKMRNLPPKTQQSPTGIVAAVDDETAQNYFKSIHISGRGDRSEAAPSSREPPLTVRPFVGEKLEQRQDARFDPDDSRSLELKFCAKLLLP